MSDNKKSTAPARASTGLVGLDEILGGGLTASRMYLIEGTPGTGKTTFALRFLMAGAELGESGLYITLSETAEELRAVVDSHGWSLDGIELHELANEMNMTPDAEQFILHPSEIELGETIKSVTREIERLNPKRVVFDSLSEMRLLAQEPLRYRRQILALKQFFSNRDCTVLMLDDKTGEAGDLQLHSIAHGVVSLDQVAQSYGTERRHLRVVKMRGMKFQGGYHDFILDTGRVAVFPRLVAANHHTDFVPTRLSTGLPQFDAMLGGGLVPGTNTLLLGPSGVGKTTTAMRCLLTALQRGERVDYYLFDEGLATLLARCRALGMDVDPYLASGQLNVNSIDPASLSPGEFAHRVMNGVKGRGATFVAIDSLNAYLLAMPGQTYLMLHMHELLTFLNQQGVVTILVVAQHGLVTDGRSDFDLSYLSDSVVVYRYFGAHGAMRTALAVIKSRTGETERSVREFRLSARHGLQVGEPLIDSEELLDGLPTYRGATAMIPLDAK